MRSLSNLSVGMHLENKNFGYKFRQKYMGFVNQELPQCVKPEEQFCFETRQTLNQIQNCVIDNIWNILSIPSTLSYKIAVINALVNYFQTTIHKLEGKKISCYTVLIGSQAGVYTTWDEVKFGILGNERSATYKGYCSLEEAFSTVRASVGPNYFISILLKEKNIVASLNKTYMEAVVTREKEEERRLTVCLKIYPPTFKL